MPRSSVMDNNVTLKYRLTVYGSAERKPAIAERTRLQLVQLIYANEWPDFTAPEQQRRNR